MLRVLSAPVFYALELTPACNNRCAGCSNGFSARERAPLTPSDVPPLRAEGWLRVLEQLAPHAQRLKLTGGEPTLHPDFPALLAAIESRALDFTLFTNARWTDPTTLVQTLRECPHLTGLLVSLHGATARTHESFTGTPGSFAETLANVELAITQGLPVAFSTVLTAPNLAELSEIVSLAERLRVRSVVFNRYMGEFLPGLTLDETALAQALSHIEALRKAGKPVKYGNCIPQCFAPNSSQGCLAGVAYGAIDPWGNLRPCTLSSLRAGNLLTQPLEEVWHSPTMERFRASIPAACHHCHAFAVCHGGCKALALELTLPADPLARPGAPVELPAPPALRLNPAWRPTAHYQSRPEAWGLVLLQGNQLLPLHADARPLLETLDGQKTVGELHEAFGPPILALMGDLLRHHMLSFTS